MKFSKNHFIIILLLTITAIFIAYFLMFKNNVKENGRILVNDKGEINKIVNSADSYLHSSTSFKIMLTLVNQLKTLKPGSYRLEKGMNNFTILKIIVIGRQSPIKLTFNNQDSLEKLAGRIASEMEFDSIALLNELHKKDYLKENGFTKETVLAVFIPNTYEIYWNTSTEKFVQKMLTEFHVFWNEDRREKAKKINLSPIEVQILASIVQKETADVTERPMVAGLYLNRLKAGWPLQADPTVVYAIKLNTQKDTVIKRVLKKHLLIASPYNTYQHKGLPPGLIAMPDISSIESVLNAKNHSYFYMCASTEKIGSHLFAKTLKEHNRNAIAYQKWLNHQIENP